MGDACYRCTTGCRSGTTRRRRAGHDARAYEGSRTGRPGAAAAKTGALAGRRFVHGGAHVQPAPVQTQPALVAFVASCPTALRAALPVRTIGGAATNAGTAPAPVWLSATLADVARRVSERPAHCADRDRLLFRLIVHFVSSIRATPPMLRAFRRVLQAFVRAEAACRGPALLFIVSTPARGRSEELRCVLAQRPGQSAFSTTLLYCCMMTGLSASRIACGARSTFCSRRKRREPAGGYHAEPVRPGRVPRDWQRSDCRRGLRAINSKRG
jgi:hypothetical protein